MIFGNPNTNDTSLRSIYPGAYGQTFATQATGVVTDQRQMSGGPAMVTDEPDQDTKALSIGGQASPVVGMVVLFVLIVGFMFLAKKLGTDDDFKSIRPTVYNGLTISGAAIIFMPVWKYLFTRFPVPGVTTWVRAA